MLFNSYQFIFVFLPIVLAVCFALGRYAQPRIALGWLVLASLVYYGSWNLASLPVLLASLAGNYLVALTLVRQPHGWRRKGLLVAAVAGNLGALGYYKYAGFLTATVSELAGVPFHIETILLPLGISFFTFQQIALLVDVGNGTVKRLAPADFVLFIVFFPQLIAGPIVHHREIMPQFAVATFRPEWSNLAVGLSLFAIGLCKKAVLADGISGNVAPIFTDAAAGRPVTLVYAWVAAIGFTLQMYFDFSGYSDMALGLSRMLGIRLPVNFHSPLKADNIIAFWSRWHITLTRFFTEHIYNHIVLAVARRRRAAGKPGTAGVHTTPGAFVALIAMPTVVTMFLSGLWHGAGMQYLAFGLMHGAFLTINHAWRRIRPRFWADAASYRRVMHPLGLVLTFLAVALGMTMFRSASVAAALNVFAGMVGLHGVVLPDGIAQRLDGLGQVLTAWGVRFEPGGTMALLTSGIWIASLLVLALVPPNALEILDRYEPAIARAMPAASRPALALAWRPDARWAAAVAAMLVAGVFALNRTSEFLYWQF